MSDATTTTTEPKLSLFTRLGAVEAELQAMRALLAELRIDNEALREDRDEWRWRAEHLLAEREQGLFERWGRRLAKILHPAFAKLPQLQERASLSNVPLRFVRLKLDKAQDDRAVALARLAHGAHPLHDKGLDLDEGLTSAALHGPAR